MELLILVGIGLVGGLFSGMLGIGGAILLVPMLLYFPPLMGLHPYDMGAIAGMTIVQVLVASVIGMLAHRKAGYLVPRVAIPMSIGTGLGALVGGVASKFVSNGALQGVFAFMALAAAILMVLPSGGIEHGEEVPESFNPAVAGVVAGGVGVVSGLMGAGGAFMLAPLMRSVLRLPLRLVIGNSLAIVLVSAVMGVLGKAATGQIPWAASGFLVLGAIGGTPLGAKLGHRMNVRILRWLLAGIIAFTALKMMGRF